MIIDRSIVIPDFRLMTPEHVVNILSSPPDEYGFHIGPDDAMLRHNPALARVKGVVL